MKTVILKIISTINNDGSNNVRIEGDMSTLVMDAAVACQCAVDGLKSAVNKCMEAENVNDVDDIDSVINDKLGKLTFNDILTFTESVDKK